MDRYNAIDDPLCYPGSTVLRNKADIADQDELDQFEQLMFLSRAEEKLPVGNLDYEHYRSVHRHFFQDVYEWAGTTRKIRTGKGDNWFCYPEFIDTEMERIFRELKTESLLIDIEETSVFAGRAGYYISEINAVHPFREGNGRCQLTLLTMLVEHAGLQLDENRIDAASFMAAMVESFSGNLIPLTQQIEVMISARAPD